MATELKRITISMPDEVASAVEALAQAQGVPQSKAVISVLVEFAPAMLSLAKFMDQMKAGQKSAAKETIRHLMGDSMAELMREQMDLVPAKKAGKK
jgi:metal-responsive CopG/Arc/MetJ family transcriptional regulator